MVTFNTGINLELATDEKGGECWRIGTHTKVWHRNMREGDVRQNRCEVCPRRKFCGRISKTLSELGGMCTEKTSTENAPRGANDDPATARKRSKLRPVVAQSLGHSDTNMLGGPTGIQQRDQGADTPFENGPTCHTNTSDPNNPIRTRANLNNAAQTPSRSWGGFLDDNDITNLQILLGHTPFRPLLHGVQVLRRPLLSKGR